MWWLQVAVQGITDEEVPWYKLVTPLASGAEGAALSLAKHLVGVWQWNTKVCGDDDCSPALSILNIGQFFMDEEAAGGVGEPHWFMAYSCTLQQVGEVACGRKWEWLRREALEIKAFRLVRAFWCETDVDLTMASVKLCWEPTPRALYHQRDNDLTTHVISYLDELAVCIPTLKAWDQMVWPATSAILHALTEAESYGYCQSQAVDLGPVMLVAQFWVMKEGGAYLCTARALVFKGSILACKPALNKAEWVPARSVANDLSWAKQRSAVALANYVLRTPAEAARIARLGADRIVSCPGDDSSTSAEEEEAWHPPRDTDPEVGDESEDGAGGQTNLGDAVERDQWWHPQNWEAAMEEAEGLAYDDPRSDSDATVTEANSSQGPELSLYDEPADFPPNTPRSLAPCMLGLPMEHMPPLGATVTGGDAVEVHVDEEELNDL